MTKARELAQFITGLRYSDLPGPVVEKAKEVALNTWGVQLAASTLPWCKIAYEVGRSQGGAAQSTVVHYGTRTSAAQAAFINGTFGHGIELDDNHPRASVKGGCVVVPTALAVGELCLSSGVDFITAVVAGYEVMIRLALAARPDLDRRRNHPTGTCGALGAAAVAGKLLGMDEDTMAQALGIASNYTVGFSEIAQGGRGHVKRVFGGLAASGGIQAALLASAGLTGPETTLDAGRGFCRSFGIDDAAVGTLTRGLGTDWEILACHYKVYAQDGYIQPMTEGLEQIRAEHQFRTEDIDQVWLGTNRFAYEDVIGAIREPKDLTDAQFSANFSAALYLVTGGAGFREYSEENFSNPEIWDLSKRVVLEIDDEIDQEWLKRRPRGAKVAIRLKSGEEFTAVVDNLRLMTSDDVSQKFRELSTVVLEAGRSEQLLSMVRTLERVDEVNALVPLLTGDARTPA